MKVLAIDPGPLESACLIWDGQNVSHMVESVNTHLCRYLRIHILNELFIAETAMVVEMPQCFGMPVGRDILDTCYWVGRFHQLWYPNEICVAYRKDIKLHLCQTYRAKDSNIRQALIDRFGPPGTKKERGRLYGVKKDLWSALAIAVYWMDKHEAS